MLVVQSRRCYAGYSTVMSLQSKSSLTQSGGGTTSTCRLSIVYRHRRQVLHRWCVLQHPTTGPHKEVPAPSTEVFHAEMAAR